MGYISRHLILLPQEHGGRLGTAKLWRPLCEINLEHVSGLSKLTDSELGKHYVPRHRAAVCFSQIVVNGLDKMTSTLELEDIAPHIIEESRSLGQDVEAIIARFGDTHIDLGRDIRFVSSSMDKYYPAPTPSTVQAHNRSRQGKPAEVLERARNEPHFISRYPLRWVSCRTVAEWFRSAQRRQAEAWREAHANPLSAGVFHSWLGQMRALRNTEARVLFTFNQD